MFGSYGASRTSEGHRIGDGPLVGARVATQGAMNRSDWPESNSFGRLTEAWNADDTMFVGRADTICELETKARLPGCSKLALAIAASNSGLHGMLGGAWGCEMRDGTSLSMKAFATAHPETRKILEILGVYLNLLWRSVYKRDPNCGACDMAVTCPASGTCSSGDGSCRCFSAAFEEAYAAAKDDDEKLLKLANEALRVDAINSAMKNAQAAVGLWQNTTGNVQFIGPDGAPLSAAANNALKIFLAKLVLHPAKVAPYATPLAASNDPLFWVTHNAWERVWHYVQLHPSTQYGNALYADSAERLKQYWDQSAQRDMAKRAPAYELIRGRDDAPPLPSAPAYELIRGRDDDAPLPSADDDPLPSADAFFATGTDDTCCEAGAACCFDVYRFCCVPRPGAARGERVLLAALQRLRAERDGFIWPVGCPCGLCTCCFPLKIFDVACCCCRTPQERCDSFRYVGQRVLHSGIAEIPALYPFPPAASEREAYDGRAGPWYGAHPNRFVSFLEALGDFLTSCACLAPLCARFNAATVAPTTTWRPANRHVGRHDRQMNDNKNFGGGEPLPTNCAPGDVGSRVIFWAHGSAFAVTQAKDFLWLFGQMLAEQTGQVVLLGEYGLTSSTVAPAQLEGWSRTYAALCEFYGAANVVVAGDSAGGNLALATVLRDGAAAPGALALLSPWVDLRDEAVDAPSVAANAPERGRCRATARGLPAAPGRARDGAYANEADRSTALVSPGAAVAAKLAAAGLDVATYVAAAMPHDAAVAAAGLIYATGLGFAGLGDYGAFEPTRVWAEFLGWLATVPGWEATRVPPRARAVLRPAAAAAADEDRRARRAFGSRKSFQRIHHPEEATPDAPTRSITPTDDYLATFAAPASLASFRPKPKPRSATEKIVEFDKAGYLGEHQRRKGFNSRESFDNFLRVDETVRLDRPNDPPTPRDPLEPFHFSHLSFQPILPSPVGSFG
ncbi:carboxylic ester hydrolase [Aureococcus anophagefferens]|nr:carboxylic ester hydrolase [Aureococcus anophagefferens]